MEVHCSFKVDTKIILGYRLKVTRCNITNPADRIVTFKGEHDEFRSNDDVKALEFFNTIVEYFPKDLSEFFQNLTRLEIINCGLKEISRDDLNGLENLEALGIINCELTTLPDDLFTYTPKLHYIDFSYNSIAFATSKLVKPFLGRFIHFDLRSYANCFNHLYILRTSETSKIKTFGRLLDETFREK